MCGGRRGRRLVREAEAPLEVGAPWGWGYDMSGAGLVDRGRWRWSWVEQEADGRWVAGATPLEVVVGAPLELAGERERMVWDLSAGMAVSSSGRGRGVD